jgi:hypothetical protein
VTPHTHDGDIAVCTNDDIAQPQQESPMRYENLGPVANPDGSPSDLTRAMLAGTGRDPGAFAREARQAFLQGHPIGSPGRPAMVGGQPFVLRDEPDPFVIAPLGTLRGDPEPVVATVTVHFGVIADSAMLAEVIDPTQPADVTREWPVGFQTDGDSFNVWGERHEEDWTLHLQRITTRTSPDELRGLIPQWRAELAGVLTPDERLCDYVCVTNTEDWSEGSSFLWLADGSMSIGLAAQSSDTILTAVTL